MVKEIFVNAISLLSEEDSKLPEIGRVLPLLLRGIGVHHSGLLPIIKEVIEILFGEGLIKVSDTAEKVVGWLLVIITTKIAGDLRFSVSLICGNLKTNNVSHPAVFTFFLRNEAFFEATLSPLLLRYFPRPLSLTTFRILTSLPTNSAIEDRHIP